MIDLFAPPTDEEIAERQKSPQYQALLAKRRERDQTDAIYTEAYLDAIHVLAAQMTERVAREMLIHGQCTIRIDERVDMSDTLQIAIFNQEGQICTKLISKQELISRL